MHELRLYEPATLLRLHALLDNDNGADRPGEEHVQDRSDTPGMVHVRDASVALLLLSGDSWRQKLRHAFFLYDADGRGKLHRVEWQQLLRAFGVPPHRAQPSPAPSQSATA